MRDAVIRYRRATYLQYVAFGGCVAGEDSSKSKDFPSARWVEKLCALGTHDL